MRWDENGQRNLVNPWRVSWNDWSFKLSFLPGPWSHRTFWSFFFWHPKKQQPQSFDVVFSETWGEFLTTHTHTHQWRGLLLLFVWNFCSKEFHSRGPEKLCCVSFNTKDFHNNRFDRDYVEFNVRISEAQISMGCQGLRPRVGRIPGVPGTWKKSPES